MNYFIHQSQAAISSLDSINSFHAYFGEMLCEQGRLETKWDKIRGSWANLVEVKNYTNFQLIPFLVEMLVTADLSVGFANTHQRINPPLQKLH